MPWYSGPPLLDHLETVHIASDRNLTDLRFPVQYVLRPNLDFRGFSGTVASGIVRKGDEVMVLPSGKLSRVKSIVTYDGELEEAFAPQAVTVTLTDEVDVSRGDMLVRPDRPPHVSSQIEAMVVWMAEQPLMPGRTYTLKHTTRQVAAEVAAFRYGVDVNTLEHRAIARLGLNEVGHVQLSLTQALACDPYRTNAETGAFILIDRLTNNTVGAGMVLVAGIGRAMGDVWAAEPAALLKTRESLVAAAERELRYGQVPVTVLLVGLTGSGKSRIAYELERRLWNEGRVVTVLYGQNMRQGLNRDPRFYRRRSFREPAPVSRGCTVDERRGCHHHRGLRGAARGGAREGEAGDRAGPRPGGVLHGPNGGAAGARPERRVSPGRRGQNPADAGRVGRIRGAEIVRPPAPNRPDQHRGVRSPHRRVDDGEGLSARASVTALSRLFRNASIRRTARLAGATFGSVQAGAGEGGQRSQHSSHALSCSAAPRRRNSPASHEPRS